MHQPDAACPRVARCYTNRVVAIEDYLGVWVLDPSTCEYGDQPAPQSATYSVIADGAQIWFHARWIDADGGGQQVSFRTQLDGWTTPNPADPHTRLTARFDAAGLSTELRRNQDTQLLCTRMLHEGRLQITQTVHTPDGPVQTSALYDRADVKQVLVYRRDLKMRKGKIAAQCAHAAMAVFFRHDSGPADQLHIPLDGPMAVWAKGRFAKEVLSVESEADLLRIAELAQARGIPNALITDAGKTEFKGQPTRTTVAIGPAADREIDLITGPQGLVATKLA